MEITSTMNLDIEENELGDPDNEFLNEPDEDFEV